MRRGTTALERIKRCTHVVQVVAHRPSELVEGQEAARATVFSQPSEGHVDGASTGVLVNREDRSRKDFGHGKDFEGPPLPYARATPTTHVAGPLKEAPGPRRIGGNAQHLKDAVDWQRDNLPRL